MSSRPLAQRMTRIFPCAALLAVAACSGVIGIEELHQGPAPGGGSGGASGGEQNSGGSQTIPSGGENAMPLTGGDAGMSQGGAGGSSSAGEGGEPIGAANGGARGGASPTGGSAGNGGAADSAGAGGGTTTGKAVTGQVIDYWGHPLPDVPVEIGGAKTTTDATGAFTIPNVAPEYDASLIVQFPNQYDGQVYGWVFQGLTRRDPTLQVAQGLQLEDDTANVNLTHSDATLTSSRTLTVSLGGPDGAAEFTDVTQGDAEFFHWRGPTTTNETAYGLIWQQDANNLPFSYIAFDSQPFTFSALTTTSAVISLDMSADSISSATITGTATHATSNQPANSAFVQFPTGASITLLSDDGPATFSYLVPTIANSSIIFAASETGYGTNGSFAVVHKDGLAPGKTDIAVQVPLPPSQLTVTPAASINKVDPTTQFSFHPSAPGPFVIQIYNADDSLLKTDGLYIVTSKTTFTLPEVVNDSFGLIPGDSYDWQVQTHGPFADVDAMAAPGGFLDPFSGSDYEFTPAPRGPRRGDGTFTISNISNFKLAP